MFYTSYPQWGFTTFRHFKYGDLPIVSQVEVLTFKTCPRDVLMTRVKVWDKSCHHATRVYVNGTCSLMASAQHTYFKWLSSNKAK